MCSVLSFVLLYLLFVFCVDHVAKSALVRPWLYLTAPIVEGPADSGEHVDPVIQCFLIYFLFLYPGLRHMSRFGSTLTTSLVYLPFPLAIVARVIR